MKLGFLYLTSVADDALSVHVDIDGQSRQVLLTATLSFNSPDEPLDQIHDRGDRNRIYKVVADWASKQLKESVAPPRTSPEVSGKRHELAIFIEERRGHWEHQFFWPSQPDAFKPDLDCPQPAMLVDDDIDGEMLFQLLFGSDQAQSGQLLQHSFGTDRPADPTYAPLRVRLVTANQQLRRLPWSDMAYQGRPLRQVGWTVELHARARPGFPEYSRHLCYFPGRLVLAASAASQQTPHFNDLRQFFQHRWPGNPEPALAADAIALRAALHVGSTRLVYYYGPASAKGLLVDDRADGACVKWADLADWLKQSQSVSLVFLNLVGETVHQAIEHAPTLLDGVKGAVLVQCNSLSSGHSAAKAGLAWLDAVLCRRIDPVVALHQQPCGQISACTHYSIWETKAPARLQNPDLVKLLLDRRPQRNALSAARDDFYRYSTRTIHHVVAIGTPGCLTSEFPQMIRQHLVGNSRDKREVYFHQSVELNAGVDHVQDVDDLVRRRFHLSPRQPLLDRLLDQEALAGAAFCFLVLGWQARKPPVDAARLLRAVADWCCQRLGAELGGSVRQARVRVISIVALESESADALSGTVERLIEDYDAETGLHFAELDRLAAVRRRDLRDFFRDQEVCSCDDRYREAFPILLLGDRPEMPFAEAVSTIHRGDPDNWGNLFDELADMKQAGDWPPPHYDANFWSKRDAR